MAFRVDVGKIPMGERYYLTPIMAGVAKDMLKEGLLAVDDAEFAKFTDNLVKEYLKTGQVADASIQAPVINLAEDYIAGRQVVIRAGDYIALRQYQKEFMKQSSVEFHII